MGTFRHYAIIVTAHQANKAICAAEVAEQCGCYTTSIRQSPANSFYTFLVVPDGSKEGWEGSNAGDESRERFISWMESNPDYIWALVLYGEEYGYDELVRTNRGYPGGYTEELAFYD